MFLKQLLIIMGLCILWSTPAMAKGFFVINTGDELFEVADFPKEIVAEYEDLNRYKVGYKCSHFGVLWADVRTWDCQMVGINPNEKDTYYDLPKDILAALANKPEYQENKMQRSFWNKFGFYLIIALILVSLVVGRMRKSKD